MNRMISPVTISVLHVAISKRWAPFFATFADRLDLSNGKPERRRGQSLQ